ncbi:MAG TPA: hypothetical protein ENJ50_01890 [Planctomycetaceae bacterium]|nr:hypothetical protein [Planctomycetaceae bacterium]
MVTEEDILDKLRCGVELPPLKIRLESALGRPSRTTASVPDALVTVRRGNVKEYQFAAELRSRTSPRVFNEALRVLQNLAAHGQNALLVAPFLREEQLRELEDRQLSGIDLCGNGVVIVPGELLVFRTGQRNQYPDSAPTKYIYRGTTSLVPRVFLCRSEFGSLADIRQEIDSRGGGQLALSTISKALKRLESDLIIERRKGQIRLIQPAKLLDEFARSYELPNASRTVTCSVSSSLRELYKQLRGETSAVLSGGSSVSAYAVMARDEVPVLYCRQIDEILDIWDGQISETNRFVDVELRQVRDTTVYFDRRIDQSTPYASPVQTFLELSTGDKRDREVAEQVRAFILKELPPACQ